MKTFMDEFAVVPGRTGGAEIIMSKKIPSGEKPFGNGSHGKTNSDAAPKQEA
jgi:CDGSH-type Zn-finger protein